MLDALRALLPRPCPGCAQPLGRQVGLCSACRLQLKARVEVASLLSSAREAHLVTLGAHRGALRRAVRELKYGAHRDLAAVLGSALAGGVPREWGVAAVSAVPMHQARLRQRGYNHAELLARAVAAELGVPYVPALIRQRATSPQARLSAQARRANLQGAFALQRIPPQPLLLLDDVMTTATTLQACRDALRAGGVEQLYYAVLSR